MAFVRAALNAIARELVTARARRPSRQKQRQRRSEGAARGDHGNLGPRFIHNTFDATRKEKFPASFFFCDGNPKGLWERERPENANHRSSAQGIELVAAARLPPGRGTTSPRARVELPRAPSLSRGAGAIRCERPLPVPRRRLGARKRSVRRMLDEVWLAMTAPGLEGTRSRRAHGPWRGLHAARAGLCVLPVAGRLTARVGGLHAAPFARRPLFRGVVGSPRRPRPLPRAHRTSAFSRRFEPPGRGRTREAQSGTESGLAWNAHLRSCNVALRMGAASPLEPGQIVAGRYRVERLIGEGGMGSVYVVQHVHTDERLALKVLHAHVLRDATAVERFRREARAPARIASEHVARVTDADTAPELDGAPFYVMELLRGQDLCALVGEHGMLPPATVVEYLRQAARALDKAHALGIIHRDLKPDNLFLTTREDGSPCIKLLDFGIARLAAESERPGQLKTQAGAVFGTPAYMSPEQTAGSVDLVGPGTDIWALGLIAFRLLTGQDFWQAPTIAMLHVKILAEPIPLASERGAAFGPAFDAWFARCVNRAIDQRFRSAGEAVDALAAALGVQGYRGTATSSGTDRLVPAGARAPFGVGLSAPADARSQPGPLAPLATAPPSTTPARATPLGRNATWAIAIGGALALGVAGLGAYVAVREPSPAAPAPAVAFSAEPASEAPTAAAPALATSGAAPADSGPDVTPAPPEPTPPPAPAAEKPSRDRPKATGTAASKPAPASSAKPASAPPAPAKGGAPTPDQRRRLDALERLCHRGTLTPAECSAKRAAILSGSP